MSRNKPFAELLEAGPSQNGADEENNMAGITVTYTAPENKLPKLRELYAAAMAANEISTSTYAVAQGVADRYVQAMNQAAELAGITEGTPFEFDLQTGVFTVSLGS